jgi:hypothetical protein
MVEELDQLGLKAWSERRPEGGYPESPEPVREPYPPILESMRPSLDAIWADILLRSDERPRSLLFCGSSRNEGNSFVAFHFSLFLALEYGLKTLYVESGLDYAPKPGYLEEARGLPGLSSYILQNQALASIVLQTRFPNLFAIPAGYQESRGRYCTLIHQKGILRELMGFCREHFDITVVDGQAVSLAPSAIEFARVVDQVILTIRYGDSRREVCRLVVDKLAENGIRQLSAVLNDRQYPVPAKLYSRLK